METMSTKQRIEEAIRIVRELIEQDPGSKAAPVVLEQLEFLKREYDLHSNLKSVPKGKMTLGVIAAKEYDTAQPRLADLLYEIAWMVEHEE